MRVAQHPPSCPPRSRSMRGTRQTASPLRRAPPGERTPQSERSGHGLRTRTDSRSPAPSCPWPAPFEEDKESSEAGPCGEHQSRRHWSRHAGCRQHEPGVLGGGPERAGGAVARPGDEPLGGEPQPHMVQRVAHKDHHTEVATLLGCAPLRSRYSAGRGGRRHTISLEPQMLGQRLSRNDPFAAVRRFAPATARVEGGDGHDLPGTAVPRAVALPEHPLRRRASLRSRYSAGRGRRRTRPSACSSEGTRWKATSLGRSRFCPPEPGVLAAATAHTPGVRAGHSWAHRHLMLGGHGRAHHVRGARH